MKILEQMVIGCLAATALVGTTASVAQDMAQSPASAHAFLQAVSQVHPVLVTDFSMSSPSTRDVTGVESSGCTTKLTSVATAAPPIETVLDWKAIRTGRVENESDLRLRGRGVDVMLGFETRELATRVANALTVIRRGCDQLAGFGF